MKKIQQLFHALSWWQWLVLTISLVSVFSATGIAWGYSSGVQERQHNRAMASAIDVGLQYEMALTDMEAGRYDLARQRLEYVIRQNPEYPGAVDRLAEVLIQIAQAVTAETIVETPTPQPTPTPDTRTIDELFANAQNQFHTQDWKILLQTIQQIRDIDPNYQPTAIDRMLFVALRMNGIDKILNWGDLEGGVYDLSLAERFVMLDSEANIYREWANLYQLGASFWGIFPEKSVYFFSQLATVAPNLRDFSGIFAKDRYRLALIQYGDHLAALGDWCLAREQYGLAQGLVADDELQPTAVFAVDQCNLLNGVVTAAPPEVQITPTLELTPTLEVTPTLGATTPTETPTPQPPAATPTETTAPTQIPESP